MARKTKTATKAAVPNAPDTSEITTKDAPANWGDMTAGWSTLAGLGMFQNNSGVQVTPYTALQSSAVYACVKRLSTDVAKLPLRMMRKLPNGGWEEETNHPVARLLRKPNRRMTKFEFVQTVVMYHQLHGNAYVAIVRDEAGIPVELVPMTPGAVSVTEASTGDLFYDVSSRMLSPNTQRLRAEDVIHVRNLSLDNGIRGASPIALASEVMGLTLAAQTLAANTFKQGAHFSGTLSTDQKLSPEQINQTSRAWHESSSGVGNAGKTPVLQGGLKFDKISQSAEESQLLESRKFAVEEVCRIFGVPPAKLHVVDRATTGNNVEEQNQSYIDDTLMAITRPIEEALEIDLLFGDEAGKYAFNFDYDELLRGNRSDRYAAHSQALQNGFMSINEVRAAEKLLPIEGGDTYRIQLNLADVSNFEEVANASQPKLEESDESK
jgi:HK97 family phage portal protein